MNDPTASDVRASGFYVRIGSQWFASARTFKPDAVYPDLALYGPIGDDDSPVPVSEAAEIVRVDSSGEYGGVSWTIGSLWAADGRRVRTSVPATSRDIRALLFRDAPDNREISKAVPGAQFHDPRGSNGGVSVRVAVSELSGYSEQRHPITGVTHA